MRLLPGLALRFCLSPKELVCFVFWCTSSFFALRELQEFLLPLSILQFISIIHRIYSMVYKRWCESDHFDYISSKASADSIYAGCFIQVMKTLVFLPPKCSLSIDYLQFGLADLTRTCFHISLLWTEGIFPHLRMEILCIIRLTRMELTFFTVTPGCFVLSLWLKPY